LALFGYKFNKYLSVRVSYLRPVLWVHYKNVNGDQTHHSVTMNISGLTLKGSVPVSKDFSIYGEGGFGIVTRTGFTLNNIPVVKNAGFVAFLGGAGLQYELNDKINFMLSGVWSPASAKAKQPYTLFFSGGVAYNMHPLSAKRVEENRNSGYIFPKNLVQVGFTTNVLGYGVNNFFSNKILPIFWGGDVQVKHGFALHYQHNVFHGRKLFSVDWGASFSYWTSNVKKNNFYTLSLFPLFRFTVLHFKTTDLYFNYSVAGPTYISMERIDNTETGKHFTFQDFMGMGMYTGKKRNLNAEIRISHYSNGDLYPQNNGVKVPLTFAVGYTF
jgi:Lipid A 3-O-deacylase (PagL)/Outer membrane protein beta-barrel domain